MAVDTFPVGRLRARACACALAPTEFCANACVHAACSDGSAREAALVRPEPQSGFERRCTAARNASG
eukprot:6173451-Pleurochrysis_carterae.AAC.2